MENENNGGASFAQPTLENVNGNVIVEREDGAFVERKELPVIIDNSSKADELSLALAESRKPVPAVLFEPEKPIGKYALDYSLKGEAIHETHSTIRSALARVAALGRLGIVPATSTNV